MAHVEYKDVVRALREQGWRLEQASKASHVKALPPDGRPMCVLSDSGDPRAIKNSLSQLRKSGFVWPWPPTERRNGAAAPSPSPPVVPEAATSDAKPAAKPAAAPLAASRDIDGLFVDLKAARREYFRARDRARASQRALDEATEAHRRAVGDVDAAQRLLVEARVAFDEAFATDDGA